MKTKYLGGRETLLERIKRDKLGKLGNFALVRDNLFIYLLRSITRLAGHAVPYRCGGKG